MLYCDAITDAMTKGLGQQKMCVRYNIFTSALDVIFLYLLLPGYGMSGYFISFLVTHLLNFLLSLRRLLKITGVEISISIPARAILCSCIGIFLAGSVHNALLRAISGGIILCCLLYLTGVVHRKDGSWLLQLIKPAKNVTAKLR